MLGLARYLRAVVPSEIGGDVLLYDIACAGADGEDGDSDWGLIEMLPRACTMDEVARQGGVLDFLVRRAACEAEVERARLRLRRTHAFWSALTYVCGVGDRHASNVLLCAGGALVHIDNGFALGADPKPGMAEVRVSREVVEVGAGGMVAFLEDASAVYSALRREAFAVAAFMAPVAPVRLAAHLRRTLALDLPPERAAQRFRETLWDSCEAVSHRANDAMRAHLYDRDGAAAVLRGALVAVGDATRAFMWGQQARGAPWMS